MAKKKRRDSVVAEARAVALPSIGSTAPADLSQWASLFGLAVAGAPLVVTANNCFRSPAFFAATRAIAETVGMLPVAFRRREGEGWKKVDHPGSRLLNLDSNPWTSGAGLRTQLTVDAILHKNGGLAKLVRVQGEIRELHRVMPSAFSVEVDETSGEPSYKISRANGQPEILTWREVIHITMPGWAADRPGSPLTHSSEAVRLDILMADHQAKTFEHGGLPRIVLSPEGAITEQAMLNALEFFTRQAGGAGIGKPIVLPAAFKESFRSFGLTDMQFLELRRLVIEDIARGMRVPSQLIGDLTKSTYNNTETQSRNFLIYALLPWLEVWEGTLTRAFIPFDEREDLELEFITEDLLRGDIAARYAAYRQAAGGAWMTPNEVRELEGRPHVDGGDELIVQAGQGPASPNPPPPESAANA